MPALQRILYVEDDDDIREVAMMALEDIGGFTLLACASGAQALAQVADFEPDLALLDVMMPEMDGLETMAALRRHYKGAAQCPVVFMTAKVQPEEISRYQALGGFDVIAKPFDPLTLSDEVRFIWRRFHE